MEVPLYVLALDSGGLRSQISLNGAPVAETSASERTRSYVQVTSFALSGPNVLGFEVQLLPQAASGGTGSADPHFTLQLRRTEWERPPAMAEEVYAFKWAGNAIHPLPLHEQTVVKLDNVPNWGWTRAPRVPLRQSDQSEIASQLVQFAQRLSTRDAGGAAAFLNSLLAEHATAANLPPGDVHRRYVEFLTKRMQSADWTVRPLDVAEIQLRTIADGRLHQSFRIDGKPVIEAHSTVGSYTMDPMVAYVDGHWLIVR